MPAFNPKAQRDRLDALHRAHCPICSGPNATPTQLRPAVRAWVDGLRSGEFEQTESYLNATDVSAEGAGMCCLGVAGELCRREHPDRLQWELDERGVAYWLVDTATGERNQQELIPFVMEWLGVDSLNPSVWVPMSPPEPLQLHDLASINDDGTSFAVIADLIEHDAELGDGTNAPEGDV
jgi:hypothetical protein